MASVSVLGMHGWSNTLVPLLGALGPSLCHGGGLRALFLCEPQGGSQSGSHEGDVLNITVLLRRRICFER